MDVDSCIDLYAWCHDPSFYYAASLGWQTPLYIFKDSPPLKSSSSIVTIDSHYKPNTQVSDL